MAKYTPRRRAMNIPTIAPATPPSNVPISIASGVEAARYFSVRPAP